MEDPIERIKKRAGFRVEDLGVYKFDEQTNTHQLVFYDNEKTELTHLYSQEVVEVLTNYLRAGFSLSRACQEAGVRYRFFKEQYRVNDGFRQLIDDCIEEGVGIYEDQLREMAMVNETPILDTHKNVVGVKKTMDTKAAEILLKARKPDVYDRSNRSLVPGSDINSDMSAKDRLQMLLENVKASLDK